MNATGTVTVTCAPADVLTLRSWPSSGAVSSRELYGGTWMLKMARSGRVSRPVISRRCARISSSLYSRCVSQGVTFV